jgi:predicted nucleic acid-binding protein
VVTALDTNIILGVFEGEESLARYLARLIDQLAAHGPVIVAPVVYAEMVASPQRLPGLIDVFLAQTPVRVEWGLDATAWNRVGLAYRDYGQNRRLQGDGTQPRRILADFIIGAHALQYDATLLTWDDAIYRAYFPSLGVEVP